MRLLAIIAATISLLGCERAYKTSGQILSVSTAGVLDYANNQVVSVSTTSAATGSNVAAGYVRISCSATSHFVAGASPTATTSDMVIGSSGTGQVFYMPSAVKLAFLQVSTGGTCSVTPMLP